MAGTSQYFEPEPSVSSRPRTIELVLPDARLTLRTDRGVFAADAIDVGTKLLLTEPGGLPPGEHDLLDLGCGYGPIALTMARRVPESTVWAVDVNARARQLCGANAALNGLSNVKIAAPDDVPDEARFAAIWSNPPIRIGKKALHPLLLQWLERLVDGGRARFVVQKHLGSDSLAAWLAERGWPAVRLRSRAGYRILEVRRG
ncbi:MAG TPA: methyltransferase [Acidimicrobiales bacterium]|nr:methyltransferase [Acidimicrobiales bacterium]